MEKENTFPVGLDEKLFLELWCNSLLPKLQVIADLILKSFPFAMPSDRPALVSVLVVQVVEASLRLVAVNNALADRSESVAVNLTKSLPGQSDWEEFVQFAGNLDPIQVLAHLNVGEEALPSAELLCSQNEFSVISQLISVGEQTGQLDEMFNSVAQYYEEEFDNSVDNMSSLIEPIMIVFMGIMIGGLMIAMYSPIFNVGALIG